MCFIVKKLNTNVSNTFPVGLSCPKCQPIIGFNPSNWNRVQIIEHIGAHIHHDASVDCSSESCRLCLHPAPHCKIVLKKAKGRNGKLAIDITLSSCPNLVKFSITSMAACFKSFPCTNQLIICQYCPKLNPAVWSYNFCHHLLCSHPFIILSGHKSLWTPSKLEKDGMKRVWQHRHKQPKLHQRAQHPTLMILETHCTKIVLR